MRCARYLPLLLLVGCSGKSSTPKPKSAPQAVAAPTKAKPRFVPAAAGQPVAEEVQGVVSGSAGERVVVYVGASWCGPCQEFHAALERGALDDELAGIKFLEYDADVDNERLENAGYGGRLIPRFALPGPDGRFGGKKIEGGIKGQGSVKHIMDRLLPLLGETT
ncbi:MAG: TlpA family protein disulfide reductase [Nannocystales bacterium]